VSAAPDAPLLEIDDLRVEYPARRGTVRAVDGVSLRLARGTTLGIVGESGCGKSTVGQAILQLIPPPGRISGGRIVFEGQDLQALSQEALRRLRGDRIAMIFQDPTATLNPVMPVGAQIAELFRWHRSELGRAEVQRKVVALLERVGIAEPERRVHAYPHELSGGMRQRVVIACALALDPALVVADEPTTALDVTVQAQILELARSLQQERGTALILISHDLGVIAEMCDRVAVMYAGAVVEAGPVDDVLENPRHPYTKGLIASRPRIAEPDQDIKPIPGSVPDLAHPPAGCPFHPRCALADATCRTTAPALRAIGTQDVACHKAA
jgi:oligopeptide/dipeptide ABC transporter ATP-binding protein